MNKVKNVRWDDKRNVYVGEKCIKGKRIVKYARTKKEAEMLLRAESESIKLLEECGVNCKKAKENTVESLFEMFISSKVNLRSSTIAYKTKLFNNHFSSIRKTKLSDVNDDLINGWIKEIKAYETKRINELKGDGGTNVPKRTVMLMKNILEYGLQKRFISREISLDFTNLFSKANSVSKRTEDNFITIDILQTITNNIEKVLYNEIFVKEEYESLEKIDLIIGSETYSFDIIGYFTGIESDIIFSTELYEIQSLKDTNNIRLFFEKNDAKYVYKEITVNKYENIDYYGFIGLYDYMNISKTILTFISFFFIFVFSIILITFFDIILYRRRKYFNLLHAIGYQKKRVFLSYFFVLLFCMLEITTLMIPISLIINRVTIEILMTNFNDINIGVDFYSILIVFSINLIVVSIYLFFNLRKKLKKITIGDEIE